MTGGSPITTRCLHPTPTPGHAAVQSQPDACTRLPMRPQAHKKADFVLEMAKNEGSKPQKRTKTPILCSGSPKTREKLPILTQKPRFCARKASKWGFRRAKAHKNLDFVLGKRGNWHREAQLLPSCKSSRTRMCPRGA